MMATPTCVWLCTRNDALSNVAVMLAALGVFGTGRSWPGPGGWPVRMAALAISGGWSVVRYTCQELPMLRRKISRRRFNHKRKKL